MICGSHGHQMLSFHCANYDFSPSTLQLLVWLWLAGSYPNNPYLSVHDYKRRSTTTHYAVQENKLFIFRRFG